MNIYEEPGAAPYASARDCTIQARGRGAFQADCRNSSVLIRRELSLDGWQAHVDGAPVPITSADEVLQAIPLPAGRSFVTFTYRPPGYVAFVTLFGIGMALMVPWRVTDSTPRRRAAVSARDMSNARAASPSSTSSDS